jgi:maleylacetoacetate isomerase
MAIQMYGFWRSNAAFRVRVALALKKLPYQEIDLDILSGRQFDASYVDVNAERMVPTLVDDGHVVFQSLAIIEYLEELHPEPRLLPPDPRDRAYARAMAMVLASDVHPLTVPRVRKHLAVTIGLGDEDIEAWCRHWTTQGLEAYERLLMRRPAAPYALGEKVTIADICVAGQVALADVYRMDLSPFPLVADLARHCFSLAAFAEAHPFAQPGFRALQPGSRR